MLVFHTLESRMRLPEEEMLYALRPPVNVGQVYHHRFVPMFSGWQRRFFRRWVEKRRRKAK